jgi:hypothetical protein
MPAEFRPGSKQRKRSTNVKKIGIFALAVAATAALASSAAFAGVGNGTPSPDQLATSQCVAQQHAMGTKAFKALYGKRAMKTCQNKGTGQAKALVANAAQTCKAEQADANFAATHNGATFDQTYGTNHNGANAFGKCVSTKAQEAAAAKAAATVNAAQACRTERGDPAFPAAHDGKSFSDFYGTNRNKRNAFGKCVSAKASAPAPTPPTTA